MFDFAGKLTHHMRRRNFTTAYNILLQTDNISILRYWPMISVL